VEFGNYLIPNRMDCLNQVVMAACNMTLAFHERSRSEICWVDGVFTHPTMNGNILWGFLIWVCCFCHCHHVQNGDSCRVYFDVFWGTSETYPGCGPHSVDPPDLVTWKPDAPLVLSRTGCQQFLGGCLRWIKIFQSEAPATHASEFTQWWEDMGGA